MKIRIKDNSVRFRMTKSEIADLALKGSIVSSTEFINGLFQYGIETKVDDGASISFLNGFILLQLSKEIVKELAMTERIGFEGYSGKVKLLVEKDFVCIDHTDEDQSDNYNNPNLQC